MYEFKCVSSRILWARMKLGNEKWMVLSVYGPGNERGREERLNFWDRLGVVL